MALAIVSRRAADDVGAFEREETGPVDPTEVCEDKFEFEEEEEGIMFVVCADRAGLPPGLSLKSGNGLVNAPWTDGRCLEGLAAKVWLALPRLIVGLLVAVPSLCGSKVPAPGIGGTRFEGVSSTACFCMAFEVFRLPETGELIDRLLGVICDLLFPVVGSNWRLEGDSGLGVGKPDGRGGR